MFDVRPLHPFRGLAVISNDDGHCGVELADAVNHHPELVVAQEGLGGDGDQGTDVVFCCGETITREARMGTEEGWLNRARPFPVGSGRAWTGARWMCYKSQLPPLDILCAASGVPLVRLEHQGGMGCSRISLSTLLLTPPSPVKFFLVACSQASRHKPLCLLLMKDGSHLLSVRFIFELCKVSWCLANSNSHPVLMTMGISFHLCQRNCPGEHF